MFCVLFAKCMDFKMQGKLTLNPQTYFEMATLYIVLSVYGILCHYGNFSIDTSYKYIYKYCYHNLLSVHPDTFVI